MIVNETLIALAQEMERYSALPDEVLIDDVGLIVRHNLELFATSFEHGRPLTPQHLRVIRESAGARAQERLPLDLVIRAYFIGARTALAHVIAHAEVGAQDVETFSVSAVERILGYLETATGAAVVGYQEEQEALLSQTAPLQDYVLRELLAGRRPDAEFGSARYTMPARFIVLRLGVAAGDLPADRDRGVYQQRVTRLLRLALRDLALPDVLSSVNHEGGVILVPSTDDARGPDPVKLVFDTVFRAVGAAIHIGASVATPEQVGEASTLAGEVLEVARFTRRPPGVYHLDDVLLDHGISRPGPTCDRLAARLDPLEKHPELIATLRAFLAVDRNRRRAARQLKVHPNTVDNRLRRTTELIGCDLNQPDQATLLWSALIARDAVRYRAAAAEVNSTSHTTP